MKDFAEIPARPVFLVRKTLPFVLIQSSNQLAWCLILVAVGVFITYLFFPRGSISFVAAGIIVGFVPPLVAALPYEVSMVSTDARTASTWLRQVRAILALFMYQKTEVGTEEKGSEVWTLVHSSWRLPWRETDIRLLIDEKTLRIQGPRSVIKKIWKRLNTAA